MNRSLLALVVVIPALAGCLGSTYLLGDWRSGDIVDQRRYSTVAPTVPRHEKGLWSRTSKALDSDDLFLRSKWWYEPGKSVIYKAVIRLVDTRSTMKTVRELQRHVEKGGMEGVNFAEAKRVETSQANLLCVTPPLYSEVRPEESSGHFVYLMACVDTTTRMYYELALVEDVVYEDKTTTPQPSNGFKDAADRFFADFRVK